MRLTGNADPKSIIQNMLTKLEGNDISNSYRKKYEQMVERYLPMISDGKLEKRFAEYRRSRYEV